MVMVFAIQKAKKQKKWDGKTEKQGVIFGLKADYVLDLVIRFAFQS